MGDFGMLEHVLSFADSLLQLLETNRHELQLAGLVGAIISAFYTSYSRWRYAAGQRRRDDKIDALRNSVERENAELLGSLGSGPGGSPAELSEIQRRRTTNREVLAAVEAVQELVRSLRTENRRSAWWAFFQNFVFFFLGSITSLVGPKLFSL
jgi:hypothetical protein